MAYDPVYSFRMPVAVREGLEQVARAEQRSLASLILKVLMDFLDERGIPWRDRDSREKRKHARRKLALPITWKLAGTGETHVSVVKDLSEGGLYMECRRPVPLPDWRDNGFPAMDLYLQHAMMPQPIHLPCRVVRILMNAEVVGIGVEFEELPDTTRMLLRELFLNKA